ncbi:phage P22-like portal protein [Paraburkholderia sp. BL23I1N1]|uniref:portal protein n=1 Tax=Paraburkholderia sp. BL23I1N1 TaxID=1938802 RepID=UPI000E759F24|nr:portal protein [Paraburkholderia sp. BL23I1N1]RKE36649.1 phage P22-like portal protein [Paraburkholderia sp. BL23I1N1]
MAKTKAEIHAAVVEESLTSFDMAYKSQQEIRLKCLQDRRFVYVDGAQWEDALRLQFDNKPRFEVNKLHMACVRIFSEYRNNRISVDYRPKDDDADDETANLLNDLYRADEQRSGGQEAYDNAFDEGIAGGFGAWRLRNSYTDEYDEDDETQQICFEPIYDADSSVFWSLDGKKYDKSDASRCWVISSMDREEYAEKYGSTGDADPFGGAAMGQPATFRKVQKMTEFDWYTPDVVYIAEYYRIEDVKRKLHVFRLLNQNQKDIKVEDADLTDEYRKDLEDQGYQHIRERTVKKRRVRKWIHDGGVVLEDCGFIAGPNIPVVPYYAKRAYIDNQERIMGHVRLGKDAQRLFNMQISLLALIAALSPRQKPIFTPEQIKGHETTWANDNIDDNPYLLINAITNMNGEEIPAGPIGTTQPPAIPPAMIALTELTASAIQEVTGEQEAGEQVVSNVSAKAVELVQNKIDMQAFIYMDNMGKSMKRCGEIWLGMARELYDEEDRRMTTIGKDGAQGVARLHQPKIIDGAARVTNDPSKGKYEVTVDVGPNFTSRRDATVRALTGMLQFVQDPQLASILSSLILSNMDGEGLDDLKEYLHKMLVKQGVIKPNEAEQREMAAAAQAQANQPPDPQSQFYMASAQEASARAGKAQADTVKTYADAANSRADAIAKLSDAHTNRLQAAMDILNTLIQQTNQDATAAAGAPAAAAPVPPQAASAMQQPAMAQ